MTVNTVNTHDWRWLDSASDFSVTLTEADAWNVTRACEVFGVEPERIVQAALALLASAGGSPINDPLAQAMLAVLRVRHEG